MLALRLRTGAPSVPDGTGLALLLGLVALALSPVMYPWALVSDVSAPPGKFLASLSCSHPCQ